MSVPFVTLLFQTNCLFTLHIHLHSPFPCGLRSTLLQSKTEHDVNNLPEMRLSHLRDPHVGLSGRDQVSLVRILPLEKRHSHSNFFLLTFTRKCSSPGSMVRPRIFSAVSPLLKPDTSDISLVLFSISEICPSVRRKHIDILHIKYCILNLISHFPINNQLLLVTALSIGSVTILVRLSSTLLR